MCELVSSWELPFIHLGIWSKVVVIKLVCAVIFASGTNPSSRGLIGAIFSVFVYVFFPVCFVLNV